VTVSDRAVDLPVVCCDLDGVIWRGEIAIPGSADAVRSLRDRGHRVVFLTNNSNLTAEQYLTKLGRVGIEADGVDIASSADAAAELLSHELSPGARILVCGGDGVRAALENVDLEPVETGNAEAVVVGWHREFDFAALDRAASAVRGGARFVATNVDATYPTPDGLLPGNGALVAAVSTASGSSPEVAGKPEAPMAAMVRRRFGHRGVMIGDRASTDGALATALGWTFALVLSGVTTRAGGPGEESIPDPPPPFIAADLAELTGELLES